jgi:hypothetical protein
MIATPDLTLDRLNRSLRSRHGRLAIEPLSIARVSKWSTEKCGRGRDEYAVRHFSFVYSDCSASMTTALP